MTVEAEVAAARRALRALDEACGPLLARFGDSVDARRLRSDLDRLPADLDLLCGAEPPAAQPPLEVIEDRDYASDFWQDAEDEGLGSAGRRAP